jgi:hypothetical protein
MSLPPGTQKSVAILVETESTYSIYDSTHDSLARCSTSIYRYLQRELMNESINLKTLLFTQLSTHNTKLNSAKTTNFPSSPPWLTLQVVPGTTIATIPSTSPSSNPLSTAAAALAHARAAKTTKTKTTKTTKTKTKTTWRWCSRISVCLHRSSSSGQNGDRDQSLIVQTAGISTSKRSKNYCYASTTKKRSLV